MLSICHAVNFVTGSRSASAREQETLVPIQFRTCKNDSAFLSPLKMKLFTIDYLQTNLVRFSSRHALRVRVVDVDSGAVDCLRASPRYLFASTNRGFAALFQRR